LILTGKNSVTRSDTMADQLTQAIRARVDAMPHIATIQPADPFLDMAGEGLRGRIFLTENERGDALCLRPEFTIPVCVSHIADAAQTPRRYGYCGTVFRQRRSGGSEFLQAGIEDLGDGDRAAADACSIADALALVSQLAPQAQLRVTLGDQAVFEAVLHALGLPRGWRKKLARAFGSPAVMEAMIRTLSTPQPAMSGMPEPIARALASGDTDALASALAGQMDAFAYTLTASRTPADIAARMIEQAALDSTSLTERQIGQLRDFLAVNVPLAQASEALRALAASLGDVMTPVLDGFEARVAALRGCGVDLANIIYDAGFGRVLDYYTGLVYEVSALDGGAPLVGGGRYDDLLTLLGASATVPGIGFSVWLDRLQRLASGGRA
jgi:ATP phosphoribosyltransferase regulatory subunit